MATVNQSPLARFLRKILPYRLWVQMGFLLVWLDPLGLRIHTLCGPVFHCYACPLALFGCPIGVIAQFTALHLFPYFAVGILVTVGIFIGSLVCGWMCPFGLLQDVAAKVPTPRFKIPRVLGYFRYVMLLGTVIAVPYFFGEGHPLFICRLCPAGGIEKALPDVVSAAIAAHDPLAECHQNHRHPCVYRRYLFYHPSLVSDPMPVGSDIRLFQSVFSVHSRLARASMHPMRPLPNTVQLRHPTRQNPKRRPLHPLSGMHPMRTGSAECRHPAG